VQLVEADVPIESHDVPMDIIATPTRTIRTETSLGKPTGIHRDELSDEQLETIPLLDQSK